MVDKLSNAVALLVEHWRSQNISIISDFSIKNASKDGSMLFIFSDFNYFYSCANGMKSLYPNYTDKEGFLFYPAESLIFYEKLDSNSELSVNEFLVFADCLHGCWTYAIRLIDSFSYEIVIIESTNSYKVLSNSLADFIDLYLDNSYILYKY